MAQDDIGTDMNRDNETNLEKDMTDESRRDVMEALGDEQNTEADDMRSM